MDLGSSRDRSTSADYLSRLSFHATCLHFAVPVIFFISSHYPHLPSTLIFLLFLPCSHLPQPTLNSHLMFVSSPGRVSPVPARSSSLLPLRSPRAPAACFLAAPRFSGRLRRR
ncbi:hypothetical protein ACOSQ3_020456 [Xanthoceras sorbifolium]